MLGSVAERFRAGGAVAPAVIRAAGNLSLALVLPWIGGIYDTEDARIAFRSVGVLPVALVLVSGAIWYRDRRDTLGKPSA
jgi:hypothetical protein